VKKSGGKLPVALFFVGGGGMDMQVSAGYELL